MNNFYQNFLLVFFFQFFFANTTTKVTNISYDIATYLLKMMSLPTLAVFSDIPNRLALANLHVKKPACLLNPSSNTHVDRTYRQCTNGFSAVEMLLEIA